MRSNLRPLALVTAFAVTSCSGGGNSGSAPPRVTVPAPRQSSDPVPVGSSSPVTSAAAYSCPTSDGTAAVARGTGGSEGAAGFVRRTVERHGATATTGPALLAVTYDRATYASRRSALATRESTAGATLRNEFDYPKTGLVTRVVAVDPSGVATATATLRAQAGVRDVAPTGGRRFALTVRNPYFTNDPYFSGFQTTAVPPGSTTPSAPTYHVGPYEESASVPGQWDMHAIGLDRAFAYSQNGNGSNVTNAGALGSSGVKIAVIDTGADTLHPELQGKIDAHQRCFITNPNTGAQSTSNFSTDPVGHGTDTTGLAGASINNGMGFVGAGGNSSILSYRVFPTPNDSCASPTSTDPVCGTDVADIASAIKDAVGAGANVISLSIGGGSCTSAGADPDPVEGNAIANAIASKVVVVAASGNLSGGSVSAPACDPGVIAAGASALDDGNPNGSNTLRGTVSAPVEYVASYSQYGSPGAAFRSPSAWGIVAPGGDPSGGTDPDDLHWIENIWTQTPYMSSATDAAFAGTCGAYYPAPNDNTGTTNCRVLIAGTSMSTPITAGAAALILGATGGSSSRYASPAAMKALLCSTADEINDPHEGCGRLNVYRAMATALGDPNLP